MVTFEIRLPDVYGSDSSVHSGTNRSKQWYNLRGQYREDGIITVPPEQFAPNRCVPDMLAYRLRPDLTIGEEAGAIEAGCIVLGLESPHAAEFSRGSAGLGSAIAPLQSASSRAGVRQHLGRLLAEAAAWLGEDLGDRQIVLANAIQYQASLQGLMAQSNIKLQSRIRNYVWHELWRSGGRENFSDRLQVFRPKLVLMAPTAPVRDAVGAMLRKQSSFPWIFADRHPSLWARQMPRLKAQPDFRWRPER